MFKRHVMAQKNDMKKSGTINHNKYELNAFLLTRLLETIERKTMATTSDTTTVITNHNIHINLVSEGDGADLKISYRVEFSFNCHRLNKGSLRG